MSVVTTEEGEYYPEPEPLDLEERRWLFNQLWGPNQSEALDLTLNGKRLCIVCDSPEGTCTNVNCIRTRITNKLHLSL